MFETVTQFVIAHFLLLLFSNSKNKKDYFSGLDLQYSTAKLLIV